MKKIDRIDVTERIILSQGFAGYCEEAECYLYARRRGYPVSYCDYYLISQGQYQYIRDHIQEPEKQPCPDFLKELLAKRPAGADYRRDYMLGRVEARKENPLPYSDGPFLFDGNYFYYHLILKGRHYAVLPIDMGRFHRIGHNGSEMPPDFRAYSFDDEDCLISFTGKDVTEEIDS